MSKIKKLFGSGDDQDDELMYGTPSKVSDSNPIHPAHADPGPKYSSERSGKFFEPSNDVNESPATATKSTKSGARFDTPGTAQQLEQPGGVIQPERHDREESSEKKSGGLMGKLFHRKDKDTEHSTEHSTETSRVQRSTEYDQPGYEGHLKDDTNYRRDAGYAGAGALGAGAVGAGAYEYSKRDEDQSTRDYTTTQHEHEKEKSGGGLGGLFHHGDKDTKHTHEQPQGGVRDDQKYSHHEDKYAHERSLEGLRDDEKYPGLVDHHGHQSSHDYGRDAGIAGAGAVGAGAMGAGAYEHNKHDDEERRRREAETEEKHKKSGGGIGGLFHRKDKDTEHHDSRDISRTEPTSSSRPVQDRPTDDTHYGREAGIAGAGALGVAGAGAAYESNKSRDTTDDDVSRATYTERSYPIGSSTTTDPVGTSSTLPTRTAPMSTTTGPTSTTTTTTTTTTSSSQAPTQQSNLGRDAAIGGAGAGVAGAGTYLAYEHTAGQHVPGEFPTEDGRDAHFPGSFPGSGVDQRQELSGAPTTLQQSDDHTGIGSGAALGTAGAGAAGYGTYQATKSDGTPSDSRIERTAPTESYGQPTTYNTAAPGQAISTDESHYGRDAAIAGGATGLTGAAGYGAYEATRGDGSAPGGTMPATQGLQEEKRDYGRDTAISGGAAPTTTSSAYDTLDRDTSTNQGVDRSGVTGTRTTEDDSHYGRDAAIAGGVGTAGAAGTYAATRDTDESNKTAESGGHSYLHKKSSDQQGEKKPGFISKLLGKDKSKDENDVPTTREEPREAATGSSTGAPLAQTRSEAAGMEPRVTDMLPVGEDGMITLHKEGSHPDSPTLVVKEKPDGSGLTTTQQ